MKQFLHHLFIPRESNNHRARILHHKSLLLSILFLLVAQFIIGFSRAHFPNVLGTATDISIQRLLSITNEARHKEGAGEVVLNDKLSQAAILKAQDMFAKNYWAHNSPDGTTPWEFFKRVGYDYTYAGENLARGFTSSGDVVDAWMASPSHRENMLSSNYREVGFGILSGQLLGEDTTLVVEEFGSRNGGEVAKSQNSNQQAPLQVVPEDQVPVVEAIKTEPLIDSRLFSIRAVLFIVSLFIFALLLDMLVVKRRNVARFVGHNIDHILYLCVILGFIITILRGVIL